MRLYTAETICLGYWLFHETDGPVYSYCSTLLDFPTSPSPRFFDVTFKAYATVEQLRRSDTLIGNAPPIASSAKSACLSCVILDR
jgi:hypothetical protein